MSFSPLLEPPLVLIIDDQKTTRMALRYSLEHAGYRVAEAVDGKQGLQAFQRLCPDIVLMDAVMPVMDGFACCAQLQAFSRSHHAPVLMITGLGDEASVDRAFESGATDFITKPIHWAVLIQRVRRLLQQAQLHDQLEATNKALELTNRELETANLALSQLVTIDSLTCLANRRCFDERLDCEWRRLAREQAPLSLILCDIDFFKCYNDSYGHQAGDICLQRVAEAMQLAAKRSADLVARYGGEEFVIVLPNADSTAALQVAQDIQLKLRELQIVHACSTVSAYITISMGIASTIPQTETEPIVLLKAADRALYEAKNGGRDRIVLQAELMQRSAPSSISAETL